jgi:hypothetical protein
MAVLQRQDVRGEGEAVGLRTLPQDISKQTLDDWKDSAAEYVRTELFAKKQFVETSLWQVGLSRY